MVCRRLQVLADREHVDVVRAQIAHHLHDLRIVLAEAYHQPRLRRYRRVPLLERLQQLQGMRIVAPRTGLAVEPRHGLQVVVQDVGRGGDENLERALHPAAKVRHQDLDRRVRRVLPHRRYAIDEMLRAAVSQIVAINAGNDDIRQAK